MSLQRRLLKLGWVLWVTAAPWTFGAEPAASPFRCAPDRQLKLVTSAYQPGQDPKSFTSQPKTLWRLGDALARLEELPNPQTGVHMLVVIASPDIWIVDLAKGSGRHLVDPGPDLVARVPVFPELTDGIWPGLELGCELSFFKAQGASAQRRDGETIYLLKDGSLTVRLKVDAKERPLLIEADDGELKRGIEYLEYKALPAFEPRLFDRPQGVFWEEPAPAVPPEPLEPLNPR